MAVAFGALQAGAQGRPLAVPTGTLAGGVDGGALPGSQQLQLTLFLTPTPDRSAALDEYLNDLTTAGSANYRKWLTPAEFGARFGATDAQMSTLNGWLQGQGLQVVVNSPGGLSVTVSGTVAQVEAAFAPKLHLYALGTTQYYAPSVQPVLPEAITSVVDGVAGLDSLPQTGLALTTLSQAGAMPMSGANALAAAALAVDTNTAPVLEFAGVECSASVPDATQAAYGNLLRQANAQGMTVLAATSCSGTGSFPAGLAEVTAVGPEMGSQITGITGRPNWQSAPGLPDDGSRDEPDFAATNFSAFAQTIVTLANESGGRLGNINRELYMLAPTPGLFYQPDGAAAGTWEPSTGLGVVNLQKLLQVFPRGAGSSFASISASSYSINYGDTVTFTSNVTSGTGGATPTGTVTFAVQGGATLCSAAVSSGTANCSPTSTISGGDTTVVATYSGDGTYAGATSGTVTVHVEPEESVLGATVSTGNTYGGSYTVTVTDHGVNSVGVPAGTVTVTTPVNGNTYTGALSQASPSSAIATVTVPAILVGTITVQASCSLSQNFKCDNPYTTTATIGKATPTMTFSYTPQNATSGQTVNLTASVGAVGTGTVPTGNVEFKDGATTLNAATLVNGTATTTGVLPTAATHTLMAQYDGDPNYATTTSNSNTTGSGATNTSITATNFGPAYGASTTITATVAAQSGVGTPVGNVTFTDSVAGSLGTVALNGSAVASVTVSTLAVGSHSISATYAPGGNYLTSSSPVPVTIAVVKATPTGTLGVSPNPPISGQQYTLTATLPATGSSAPAGSILFQDNGNVLSTVTMTNGVATYAGTLTSAATHAFTAAYAGDSNYNGTSLASTVNSTTGTATTTTLTPSSSEPVQGTAVTLTAHVSATSGTPTGTVVFSDTVAGTLGSMTLASGVAALQVSTLAAGSHSITAAYGGDATFAASTSTSAGLTVAAATGVASTVTLSVTPTSPAVGDSVIFGANISPASVVNNTPPSGAVQFMAGGTAICSGTLSNYYATCTSTTLAAGSYSVTAVYAGDSNYATATSTAQAITVAAGSGSGALTAALTSSSAGYGNTDTVTVGVASSGAGTVSGTVQAVVNGHTYASTLAAGAGAITFDVPPVGSYNVVVSCVAPLSCTGSPTTLPLTVTRGATMVTVTSSSTTPSAGSPITLTATMAQAGSGAGPYAFTGTVTFLDGATTLGTATLSGSQATLPVTLLGAKTHNLTAVYSGDTNWLGATSTATGVLVTALPATIVLSSNVSTALAGVTVNFNVSVSGPSGVNLAPTGTVTLYDVFGGITRSLGTSAVVATGPNSSIAAFAITGLTAGTHSLYVTYTGDTNFLTGTSNTISLGMTDFNVSFVPSTLTIGRGSSGQASLVVTMVGGFSGQVTFGCTPPADTETTCSFSPAVLTGSGITTLTVSTTAAQTAANHGPEGMGTGMAGGGAALAFLMALFVPRRRRGLRALGMMMAAAVLTMQLTGCTVTSTTTTPPVKTTDPGSPLGTQMFSVTSAGTDGTFTIRHNFQYQVTIQ